MTEPRRCVGCGEDAEPTPAGRLPLCYLCEPWRELIERWISAGF